MVGFFLRVYINQNQPKKNKATNDRLGLYLSVLSTESEIVFLFCISIYSRYFRIIGTKYFNYAEGLEWKEYKFKREWSNESWLRIQLGVNFNLCSVWEETREWNFVLSRGWWSGPYSLYSQVEWSGFIWSTNGAHAACRNAFNGQENESRGHPTKIYQILVWEVFVILLLIWMGLRCPFSLAAIASCASWGLIPSKAIAWSVRLLSRLRRISLTLENCLHS